MDKAVFTYDWSIEENEDDEEGNTIRIWGLDENNDTVCLQIEDFKPYVYMELPDDLTWTPLQVKYLKNKIKEILYNQKLFISYELVWRKKLYYANINNKGEYKEYPYLKMYFNQKQHIKRLYYILNGKNNKTPNQFNVMTIGRIKVKLHEHNASSILQLTCLRNLPTAGWIIFKGKKIKKDTHCNYQYKVKWTDLSPNKDLDFIPNPLILSFDIEVNSHNINKFPKAINPKDEIFQISCHFNRQGGEDETYLLTLGKIYETNSLHKKTKILQYDSEMYLLLGLNKLIIEKNPQLIIGYNILNFDIPYMIDRVLEIYGCLNEFNKMGCIKDKSCPVKEIKWSSSAYRSQEFRFLDLQGRLWVDLLPLVKRDYKFNDYKLKTVSTFFLGETKDPLDAKGIFNSYRKGMEGGQRGSDALGIVGKYCVQDSVLVTKLFHKIQTWVGLCEMAKTCNVPIFYLYTQGQQIKVFSQVYKKCMRNKIIVEHEGYIPKDDEEYTGATVFPPVPGLYNKVIPFDFASLYPTTIIAYNIDYSTLVTDENIPDDMCNIIEWEDHQGCEHDTTIRKTKTNKLICAHRKYRFLKEPKGVMPALLEYLLDTRKKTKKKMKELKSELKRCNNEDERISLEKKIVVLDKRQLAYKVSANSMYGSMGVKRGYLPFLPGAMCTTARGRQSIELAANKIQTLYGGQLIYGDTDSCYIHFPNLETSKECWDYALYVEKEVSELFPSPMKLEFEEAIYWRFFILSKKRYMALSCGEDGILDDKIEKKGVLLARRDNSKFIRLFYENIIMMIFNGSGVKDILDEVIEIINKLCSGFYCVDDFIITKAINGKEDYKFKELPTDLKKRKKRLNDLDIYCDSDKDYINLSENKLNEYKLRCLPAHIQLADKMMSRGTRVDVGSRLGYIICMGKGHNSKQYDKLEDPNYKKQHSIVKLDYLYYLKLCIAPFDQLLSVGCKVNDFVKKQYNLRLKRCNILNDINTLHQKYEFIN